MAIPYDMPIIGYNNNVVNTLMIWDAEPNSPLSSTRLTRVITKKR